MQIDFDKRYPVAATPQQAWAVLADIRATAACWPGGVLATQLDTRRYQGTVGLQVGAEAVRLDGEIELLGLDATKRELRLRGQGHEAAGSTVSVEWVAHIDAGNVPGSSALAGHVTVSVDGRLAQLDKRLLATVGDRLLAQFAENFRAAAAAVPAPQAARGGSARRSALASSGADSTLTLMVQAGQAPGAAFAAQEKSGASPPPAAPPGPRGPWAALRRWLAGVFGRRAD
ncbi:MAG: carbon monoxide dehydrogenase [Burkholderiales bacterium]|nr:carbon monoxide dehydrogenase [Burkholderiales bacterium]